MAEHWDLLVARDDLSKTELVNGQTLEVADGEVLLKVDRVGMTANNVTYGQAGDSLSYWSFFPAPDGWGRVPLWGFADVVESNVPELEPGVRVYGYLPTSSHLVARPSHVGSGAFTEGSPHRVDLPAVYNRYGLTHRDPSYAPENEDLQILYRPLFFTSFILDDFLADNDFFGAQQVIVSSASSKTGYGTAFCLGLRDPRPRLVGLTSTGNVSFTSSLACYDEVVSYDDLEALAATKTLYVDVAGSKRLRVRVHEHFGDYLVYDAIVGAAHMEGIGGDEPDLAGPRPQFFFAPSQLQKRRDEWGPGVIEKRHAEVWRQFTPVVKNWVEIKESHGPEGLRTAWLDAVAGRMDPKAGHVIAL